MSAVYVTIIRTGKAASVVEVYQGATLGYAFEKAGIDATGLSLKDDAGSSVNLDSTVHGATTVFASQAVSGA